jgi:uracil-DNA glycosylase
VHGGDATIAAVLEAPKADDVKYGRPLAGLDGGEWTSSLRAVGLKRAYVDLFHVTACKPPGKSGAWKRMEAGLRRKRKKRIKVLKAEGNNAARSKALAHTELPHPADCCRPHLHQRLVRYDYIIPLGATPAQRVLGVGSSLAKLEGDMLERKASELFGETYDFSSVDDWVVKVVPTYDPGYIKHLPAYRPQFHATLGKANRWFNNALRWLDPELLSQPTPDQLRAWLAVASPFWVYDLETSGIDALNLDVDCLAIATPDVDIDGNPTMPWEKPHRLARSVGIHVNGDLTAVAPTGEKVRVYGPEELAEIKAILIEFFLDRSKRKSGHNAGYYDRMCVEEWLGVTPVPLEETLLDARATHPDLPKGLKPTGRRITDVHKWETVDEGGEGTAKSRKTVRTRLTYCQFDTVVNARIKEPLRRSADDNGYGRLLPEWAKPVDWDSATPWTLRNLDHARQDMCVGMHRVGVHVDQALVKSLTTTFEGVATVLLGELQDLAQHVGVKSFGVSAASGEGGVDFKPGSYNQIRDLLYVDWGLGCPYGMDTREFYTDTGLPGTGDAVLRAHMSNPDLSSARRAFIMKLRQYRRVRNKVLGSQLYVMRPESQGGKLKWDGRARATWNSHTTAPGRLSASGPNMQNQSSRKDIGGVRRIYCAAPGHVLVGCDLDQAHLRVVANYWQIDRLLECFLAGKDPHCWLAHDLFGKDFENAPGWGAGGFSLMQDRKPNKKLKAGMMRELAKTYRYTSIYWAAAEMKHNVIRSTEVTKLVDGKLTTDLPYLNFELNQVRFFDKVWHEGEPDWARAWAEMLELYKRQGFMEDPLFGRRSGGLNNGKKNEVVNFPVLACEQVAMAIAERRVLRSFPFQKWGPGTGLTAQVHDSLVVEVPEHLAEWAKAEMTRCMTVKVPGWEVDFTCEAAVGRTWVDV